MSLAYHDFDTPIGTLRVVGDDGGIERIDLPNAAASDPDPEWRERRRSLPRPLREAKRQLLQYFEGERRDFDLPLAPAGTAFQRRVWGELSRIPYGETVSYGELARRIGRPTASRAVGAAKRPEPAGHRRPLPPRDRGGRHAGRLRRGAAGKGSPAGARAERGRRGRVDDRGRLNRRFSGAPSTAGVGPPSIGWPVNDTRWDSDRPPCQTHEASGSGAAPGWRSPTPDPARVRVVRRAAPYRPAAASSMRAPPRAFGTE